MIIKYKKAEISEHINLPASKSESNRCLIIQKLASEPIQLDNISEANDSKLMQKLLASNEEILDCEDAGTTYRFLLAYAALMNEARIITGSDRMKERPIKILVDALNTLGAKISYLEKVNYPPVRIERSSKEFKEEILIDASVSSQYISALMLIAPKLKKGLLIKFSSRVASRPYIELTASLMRKFAINIDQSTEQIQINNSSYKSLSHTIESDWSSAAFFYEIATISRKKVSISDLKEKSLQGDQKIVDIMKLLGTETHFHNDYIEIIPGKLPQYFEYDFTDVPDLAQAVIVSCAALNINSKFTGLDSLYIKETDRVNALKVELKKVDVVLDEPEKGILQLKNQKMTINKSISFHAYDDHRMAMSLAPLAICIKEIEINQKEVVKKSFPHYWDEINKIGFNYV